MLCCGYTLTDFPISIRLTSLALRQSNDCPSASKATLMNMDKYSMWIHYERLHNHNKATHNKTVCIFLGIYCMPQWTGSALYRVWLGADQALAEPLLNFLSIEPVGTNFNGIRIKTQNFSNLLLTGGWVFRWGNDSASTLEWKQHWSCIMGKLHPIEKLNSERWYPSIPMSIDEKKWLNHKGCVLFILR